MTRDKVISTDPSAGERVLDGGSVTVVVSLGKEVYDLPKLTAASPRTRPRTGSGHQDGVRRDDAGLLREGPEGIVIASDPKSGTTLRPGTIVDLVVSKGRRPIPVTNFVGKRADQAERVLTRRGLKVERTRVLRHVRRGPRHQPGPRTPAPCSRATPSTSWSRSAPSWSRCPTCAPRASTPPPRRSPTSASWSWSRRHPATSASATSSGPTRTPAEVPKGSTITVYVI